MSRITHVITTLERGGAENQLVILARNQVKIGFDVSVIGLKGKLELVEELKSAGVQVIDGIHGKNPMIQTFRLHKYLKKYPSDVLHLHLPRVELVGYLATFGLNIPIFISRHNTENFFTDAPRSISSLLSRIVTRKATVVIAISSSVKDFLVTRREISRKTNIVINQYGYDELTVRNQKSASINSKSQLQEFVTISRLVPQKDLYTLIGAFAKYRELFNVGTLNIYGSGYLLSELESFSERLNVEKYVFFRGRTNDSSIAISDSQCFILSSKYEGFGLVLLEAMQQGIPIICARNSAIIEVMGEHYEGFFETSNEADLLRQMTSLRKRSNRLKLVKYCSKRIDHFNPIESTRNILKIYKGNLMVNL